MCIPVNDYFIINLSFATRWAIQPQASDARLRQAIQSQVDNTGSGERCRFRLAIQPQVGLKLVVISTNFFIFSAMFLLPDFN